MPADASITFGFSFDLTSTVSNSPVKRISRPLSFSLEALLGTGNAEKTRFVEEHQKKCLLGTGLDVSPFEWPK